MKNTCDFTYFFVAVVAILLIILFLLIKSIDIIKRQSF